MRRMSTAVRILLALGAVAVGALEVGITQRFMFTPLLGVLVLVVAWHAGLTHAVVVALVTAAIALAGPIREQSLNTADAANTIAWVIALVGLAFFVAKARSRAAAVGSLEQRVEELVQIEHSYARTDRLTSLCNRRAFIDALQQAEARSRRSGGALAVARLDIDNFHRLNETYSRADGDQLLRGVATSLSLTTRMGDLAARLENDEFAILLYGCGPDDAQRVGQRIVAEVAELGAAYPEARTTGSVGIACFASPGPDPDEMMRLAGAALRRALQSGGNAAIVEREWTPPART